MPSYESKRIFAENLSRLLDQRGKTQLDLAKVMGVAASTVSSWCTGDKMPRMDKVEWLADYFDVPRSSLIEPDGVQAVSIVADEFTYAAHNYSGKLRPEDKQTIMKMMAALAAANEGDGTDGSSH